MNDQTQGSDSRKLLSDVLRSEYEAIARRWAEPNANLLHEAPGNVQTNHDVVPPSDVPPDHRAPDSEGSKKKAVGDAFLTKLSTLPTGSEEKALEHLWNSVGEIQSDDEKSSRKIAALCFSGGGIRSATFNLGVIQALARHGLLDQFDYLSTVSGGGYIGGWLMAWAQRSHGGISRVASILKQSHSLPNNEPKPVQHLRDFSRYLSPRFSLLSVETWTLPAIYVRNLMLNWLVLVPLLLAALMVPRLAAGVVDLFPLIEHNEPAPAPANPRPMLVSLKVAMWDFVVLFG